jgi:hypothetical protein
MKIASVTLKMSSKRIEIFKKASNSGKIYLKCHPIFKKKPRIPKTIAALPQRPVCPWVLIQFVCDR